MIDHFLCRLTTDVTAKYFPPKRMNEFLFSKPWGYKRRFFDPSIVWYKDLIRTGKNIAVQQLDVELQYVALILPNQLQRAFAGVGQQLIIIVHEHQELPSRC